ncbi:MAG: hypothetical protein SV775_19590 [Thermodesulfobacteriota bacterium]|nr:hypothetical protein [Thermodesulfobacteriota bacterium]
MMIDRIWKQGAGRIMSLLAVELLILNTFLPVGAWGFGNYIRVIAYNAGGMGRGGRY